MPKMNIEAEKSRKMKVLTRLANAQSKGKRKCQILALGSSLLFAEVFGYIL